jgi:hypothetical protein
MWSVLPAHKGHDLVSFQYSFVTKSPRNQTAQIRRTGRGIRSGWRTMVEKIRQNIYDNSGSTKARGACTSDTGYNRQVDTRIRHELAAVNEASVC